MSVQQTQNADANPYQPKARGRPDQRTKIKRKENHLQELTLLAKEHLDLNRVMLIKKIKSLLDHACMLPLQQRPKRLSD